MTQKSLEAALGYIARGWAPIPIPFRSKRCLVEGWPTLALTPETATRYFNGERQNIGILLGERSGGLVDVDLDCPEAIELADRFLPNTPAQFGRPTAQRSHRLYVSLHAETAKFVEPPRSPSDRPSMLVELRSTGGQTVFPPSVHELGEPIEFSADGAPLVIGASELTVAVSRLAVAVLLKRSGWVQANAIAAAMGNPILIDAALSSSEMIGTKPLRELVASWLGLEPTAVRARRHAESSVSEAVERYNIEHAREWPRSGGDCPICGHRDCFGRLPQATERWACFSSSHTEGGLAGRVCFHGDVLDVDAHEAGCGRVELLKRRGYLEERQRPQPMATEEAPTPAGPARQLRGLSYAEMVEVWRNTKSHAFIPTKIKGLDESIGGGLMVDQVTTVLGYTGAGKSEFARQLRLRAALNGHAVMHVDVELGYRQIVNRDVSQAADVASSILRKNDLSDSQYADIQTAIGGLSQAPILTYTPDGAMSLDELQIIIRDGLNSLPADKPRLVILDSAQRLAVGADGKDQRIQLQNFMWWAAACALNSNAAWLVTSEQKRSHDGKRPSPEDALTSGAESRAIEFASAIVLALIPSDEDSDVADSATSSWERRVSLLVCKTREGRLGYVKDDLLFTGPCWGMNTGKRLDDWSEKIVDFLEDNGRSSVKKIAQKLAKRRPFIMGKLKALEETKNVVFVSTGNSATTGWEAGPGGGTGGVSPHLGTPPHSDMWDN